MIGFIKFGLAKFGALFTICEALFLGDILAFIINRENVWTWVGLVLLTLFNVAMIIEYYYESRRI